MLQGLTTDQHISTESPSEPNQSSIMHSSPTHLQATLVLTTVLLGLTAGQLFNGYINPLFLPRGMRDGYRRDIYRDGYYLDRNSGYNGLDIYRRLSVDPRYDDYRRYPSLYDNLGRYSSGLDRRYLYRQYPEDVRYQSSVGLGTTARPMDRGLLDRAVLDRAEMMDRRMMESGSGLSTASPELSVTIQPNGSA